MMKKTVLFVAAAMMLCAAPLWAQDQNRPARPERPAMPEPMTDSVYAATRTAEMVEKYGLTAEQEPKVFALNLEYAPKLQMRMPDFGEQGERKDPRSMTDQERQEFFAQMQERMAEMQEMQQEREKAQKDFDKAMKEILTKEQYKAYNKDRKKEERERQRRQQQMQGGMGGPGGGFGGPGGGGFGGGMGGPGGGFGGGGFGGDF